MAFRDFFANMFNRNAPVEPSAVEASQNLSSFANLSADGRFINGTINQDQYAEYLEKDAAGELTRYSINSSNQPIVSTNASNIHGINTQGQSEQAFWAYKRHPKEDYMELASHIPEVQDRLNAGESLSSLERDPVVGECAKQYFDPANMPTVSQYGDTFIADGGNRHRIIAAQELGYDIPVRVSDVYEPNGQMQTAGNHVPPSDYGTVGNPYPQNTEINVPTQDKMQGFAENANRDQGTAEPYRATHSAEQAAPEPYRATRNAEPNTESAENAAVQGSNTDSENQEKAENQEQAEGQEQSEGQEQTEAAEKSEAPEETETAEESEAPEEAETAEESEAPEETETAEESEAPEETETAEESEAPEETETAEESDAPEEAESRDAAEDPDESQSQDESQDQSQDPEQAQEQEEPQEQDQSQDQSQDNDYDYGYGY